MAARLKRSFSRTTINQADLPVAVLSAPLEAARRREGTRGLLLVDLDNFHVLNNGLGRGVGDVVLKVVAGRLEQAVANFGQGLPAGDDRFIVLVSETAEAEPPFETIAERLMEAVRMPIAIEGDPAPVVVSASIGSVLDDGSPVDELVRCADIALKRAKAKGLNGHVRFDPEMGEAAEAEALLERDLREALDTELLFLSYLPGVDIETGRVTSAEALLRWRHPERGGVIAAREFMPLLEQSGTIVEVGNWVLKEACMQAAAWQRRGMAIALHVNLSARQLGVDALLDELRDTLSMSRLNPDLLVLEVAEATVVREPAAIAQRLNEFKSLGVNIAMDSFGSAYSNLGQLKQLPLDMVEFDRSLVVDLGRDASATALVHTLVQIAGALGLKTLAAGVENHDQLQALRSAGCLGALGHLYSEPIEADAFDELFTDFEAHEPTVWTGVDSTGEHESDGASDEEPPDELPPADEERAGEQEPGNEDQPTGDDAPGASDDDTGGDEHLGTS